MLPIDHIILDVHGPLASVHPVQGEMFAEEFIDKATEVIAKEKGLPRDVAKQFILGGINVYHTGSLMMEKLGVYDKYLQLFYDMPYADRERPELTKLIKELKKEGATILCATNNPLDYAIGQLKHIGLDKEIFEDIASASEYRPRPYGDQIRHFAKKYDKRRLVFLGDRLCSDILVARVNGVKSIMTENPESTKSVLEGLLDQIKWYKKGILKGDFTVDLEVLLLDNFSEDVVETLLKHCREYIFSATPEEISKDIGIDRKTAEDVFFLGERITNMYTTLIRAGIEPNITMFKHMGILGSNSNTSFGSETELNMKPLPSAVDKTVKESFKKILTALKKRQYEQYIYEVKKSCRSKFIENAVSRAVNLFLSKPIFFEIRKAVPEDIPKMMVINDNINIYCNFACVLSVAELNGEVIGFSFKADEKIETFVDPAYRYIELERALEEAAQV